MVLLWKVSSILFCLTLTKFGLISCVMYVENGTRLSLDPGMKGTPEDILWTFNGNKLAERDLSDFQEYGQFMKRTDIEFTTGRLTVHRMTRGDSGFYKVMIQISGKLQYYEEYVEVIDGVPEPQVTCELSSSSQSRRLLCSVTDEINVTYTWTGPNGLQSGQTLEIDEDEPPESLYICTVQNPVSQKNNSIILKDCSTEGLHLPLIIPLVIIGLILIVGASVLIYYRCFRIKRKQMSPDATRISYSAINKHEDQKREQRVHEDEGTLKNEGAGVMIKVTKSQTDENLSEQKKDDIQSESEQVQESEYSEEAKEGGLKMSFNRRESVDTNEQTDCINKISQSENCSEEHSKHQEVNEGNFRDHFEHLHDSANDSNQNINHDEDEERKQVMSEQREAETEEEKRNTDEGSEENITENSEDASSTSSSDSGEPTPCVKDRVRDIENRALEHIS